MLILCTDSLKGYGLNRIFEMAKKAGYEGIDLAIHPDQFDTINSEYVQSLIKEYGLPVHAISTPETIDADQIKEIVKMAKKLDSKVIVIQPPRIFNFKLASWLRKEIPKLREKEFISIALENAPAGAFLGFIPEHAMSNTSELKKFKHISLDTARIGDRKKDLMRSYAAFKKYLVHVHLSNVHHGKPYSLPEDGIMPLESFLTKLKQENYPGAISIKILPKHLNAGDDDKLVTALEKVKKFYDKYYTNVKVSEEKEEEGQN